MLHELLSSNRLSEINISWLDFTFGQWSAIVLVSAFGILSTLELRAPKEKLGKNMLRRSYKANFSLFAFNSMLMSLLSAASLLIFAKQHVLGQGLLGVVSNPVLKAVLAFLALDLLLYLWHKTCHRFDGLWMFHRVHHNDPCLNVSTGFRIHIVELLLTHLLKTVTIIVMGIEETIVMVNEVVTTLFIMLHHANVSFKGEKWFGLLFIAPYLHRTHHSMERNEHDSNYGAILSIWDRLFGTLTELEPAKIGIKGNSPLSFVNLLKFGFTPVPAAAAPLPANLHAMIAEAAYFKAEKRNFAPGFDQVDWLEAKNDIMRALQNNGNVQSNPVKKVQRGYLDWLNGALHFDFGH